MPKLLRKFLGAMLLFATIGLATCQSLFTSDPVDFENKINNLTKNVAK
jgi:hypothetical protein